MATLGSKDIADISKDELLRAYAAAGNKNAQQMLAGASPTPSTQSLGSRDIKDISKEEIIDAYAKSGTGTSQQKAKEIQANSYALPSYKPAGTQPSGTPLADATEALLPEAENRSSLVEFADLLNQATTLARDRRQASELGILEDYGFKPGQVRAATMGSVLNLLQQRTDTSHGALQEAAMTAYQNEVQRKATDMENKQQLALQLIGKVDETVIQGLLNSSDFNGALAMAAGALKGSGQYSDVRSVEKDGQVSFFGVKDDGTVEELGNFSVGVGGAGGVVYETYTSGGQVYQYPVDPTTGKATGPAIAVGGFPEDETSYATYEFMLQRGLAWDGDKQGLINELNKAKSDGTHNLTEGQMNDIVATWEKQNATKKVKYDYVFELLESNLNPAMLQTRGGELEDAVRDSKKDIDNIDLDDFLETDEPLTSQDEATMRAQLDKATITKNSDGTVTITIEGVSRKYKIEGNKYVFVS